MSTPPSTDRPRPRWPSAASLLLAALVAGFLLVTPRAPLGTTGLWTGTTVGSGAAWDVVLLLARVSVVAAVLVSRRRPSWALALALWPYLLWPVIGYFEWGWWLGLLCVAVLVAYDSVRGAAWPVVAVLAVAATYAATGVSGDTFAMLPIGQVSAVSPGSRDAGMGLIVFGLYAVASLAAVAISAAFGSSDRSRHLTSVAAAQSRDAEELASRAAERARVARDLHDVVAHHVSLVAVRAESAPYVHPGLDETARTVLAEIAADARGALTELRQVLVVLHRADGETAERAPQPGAADIALLVDAARAAGQDVTVGHLDADLPAAQGYVLYRAAQEALTNARRHAPGAPVTLSVEVHDGVGGSDADDRSRVVLSVANPTPGALDPAVPGRGLHGMRERVEALGGTLEAGGEGGAFVVSAQVPLAGLVDHDGDRAADGAVDRDTGVVAS